MSAIFNNKLKKNIQEKDFNGSQNFRPHNISNPKMFLYVLIIAKIPYFYNV